VKEARASHEEGVRRGDQHWLSHLGVSEDEFLADLGTRIHALYTSRSGGRRWVEQTPQYRLQALDLARMFPGARFVHLVRDGREVVHSMIHSGFPVAWATDFECACRTWVAFVEAGRRLVRELPSRCIEVHNEALRASAKTELEQVARFLGLDLDEPMLEVLGPGRGLNSSFRENRSSWRDAWPTEQRATFEGICGERMRKLWYGHPAGA